MFCIRLSAENDPESEEDERILAQKKKRKNPKGKTVSTYLMDFDYSKPYAVSFDLSNTSHYSMHILDDMLVDNLNQTINNEFRRIVFLLHPHKYP
jgi:predicted HTH transcriptional regulator